MNAKNKKFGWLVVLILSAMVVSGCDAFGASAEPTTDPNMVFTQVAETVMVSMTQTAEAVPPTPTSEPTATPEPTPTLKPTKNPDDDQSQSAQPAQPQAPTQQQTYMGDKARWLSNSPMDGATINRGQTSPLTVCLSNVGSTEWDDEYYIQYASGQVPHPGTSRWYIDAGKKVKPGEKWCFTLEIFAPNEPGSYQTNWIMRSPERIFMEEFYWLYKVN